MKKFLVYMLTLAISLGLLTACSNEEEETATATNEAGEELKVVRFGSPGQGELMTEMLGIAQKQGFFEEELNKIGYTFEALSFQSGPVLNEAFLAGEVDVAMSAFMPAIINKGSGNDIISFASMSQYSNTGIVAYEAAGINSIKDLVGKKVSTVRGTLLESYLLGRLASENIDPSQVQIVNDMSAFNSKSTDASTMTLYMAYAMEKVDGIKIIDTSLDTPDSASGSVAYASSTYLKENPEVPKAIIKAYLSAIEWAKNNVDETYEIFAESTLNTYSAEDFKKSYANDPEFNRYSPEITDFVKDGAERLSDSMIASGFIQNGVIADEFFDDSFYKAALAELEKK